MKGHLDHRNPLPPGPIVAFRAICQLAESPEQALPLLQERLLAKVKIHETRIKHLVAELGDPERQKQATAVCFW